MAREAQILLSSAFCNNSMSYFVSMTMGDGLSLTVSWLMLGSGTGSSRSDVSFAFCEPFSSASLYQELKRLEQSERVEISFAKKIRKFGQDDVMPIRFP